MKQRIFKLVLALLLLLSMGLTAQGAEGTVEYAVPGGNLTFDPGTGMIVGSEQGVTEADIPARINGVPVTGIGDMAFWYRYNLKRVTLPDTVTVIENEAFSTCEELEQINIPGSVKRIGDWAFWSCKSLKDVTIGEGVKTIGTRAFFRCTALPHITIPHSVQSLGDEAFYNCVGLTSLSVPGSIENIGSHAFALCTGLQNLTVEQGVKIIGDSAFFLCERLTQVQLPAGVTALHDHAFRECSSLREIWLPGSLTSLGEMAFYDCGSLTDLYYEGTKAQWAAVSIGDRAIPENVTIHFEAAPPCDGGDICPGRGFSDLPGPDHWAHRGIDFCVSHGLMEGTGNGLFRPGLLLSRAQLVTILYRIAGSPEVDDSGVFSDVAPGQWYSLPIAWAAEQGIVQGVGGGRFDPEGAISREQIAAILYRHKGSPAVEGTLTAFPDHEAVGNYAQQAMLWAIQQGFIHGISANGTTSLSPKNNATREQVAAIIMRYLTANVNSGYALAQQHLQD